MTVRTMALDDVIAAIAGIRDWSDREAFYYRRRGVDAHDRTHAIELEDNVKLLDDALGNLRARLIEDLRNAEPEAVDS
jgi:hypothetical protein